MLNAFSFFERRQKLLLCAATVYVIALILSHATFPPVHVWLIAAIFSILMNLVYLPEAWIKRDGTKRGKVYSEALIATLLICASLLGVFGHPGFVILAIFGHGLWDVAKHFGAGVPFFSWYTWGCAIVDFSYGSTLFLYWLQT